MDLKPLRIDDIEASGEDSQVQFNDGGFLGGDSTFIFNKTTKNVDIASLTIANACVLGSNSAVFQPAANSTTFFQLKQQDGTVFFNGDSTNGRIGIGTATPGSALEVHGDIRANKVYLGENAAAGTYNVFFQERPSVNSRRIMLYGPAQTGSFGFVVSPTDLTAQNAGFELWDRDVDSTGVVIAMSTSIRSTGEGRIVLFGVGGANPGDFYIRINTTDVVRFKPDGKVGFGNCPTPVVLTEWIHTEPYLTIHNSTHEDTDGGREARISFVGEQSGGEISTLARIQSGHDGAGDDQLGKIVQYVNTGAGLAQALEIGSDFAATFAGAINSATLTITTANDGAGIDVSGVNHIFIDSSGGVISIDDFTLGVIGQMLDIVIVDNTSQVTFTDRSTANQEMYLHDQANLVVAAGARAGVTLVCDGNDWYNISHAKHV